MRHYTILPILALFPVATVAEMPDLVCQEVKIVHVDPECVNLFWTP